MDKPFLCKIGGGERIRPSIPDEVSLNVVERENRGGNFKRES